MVKLIVTESHDYSADTLSHISAIQFVGQGNTTVEFAASQFVAGVISPTVSITGHRHQRLWLDPRELRYYQNATDTFVAGDVNGDGTADFQIKLDGCTR